MATLLANRIRQDNAVKRMTQAMFLIGGDYGMDAAAFPTRGHDPELLRAQQFEAIADWLDTLAARAQQPKSAGYDTLTNKELDDLLKAREIALESGSGANGAVVKTDKIAALNADDKARIAISAQTGAG